MERARLACLAVLLAGCSTTPGGGTDASVDAGDDSPDLAPTGCSGDYVVVGPQRSWLGAPRDVMPVACGGTESLFLMHGGALVPVTGASSSDGTMTLDPVTGAAVLQAPSCASTARMIDVRLGAPPACAVTRVPLAGVAPSPGYYVPHSCGAPPGCLGCDYSYAVATLSGGHAHVCVTVGTWSAFPGTGFEVVDETYDPCSGGPHCTRLRYDLEVIDTPVGAGLDHVPAIAGPGSVFVNVGETLVECFTAPLPMPVPPTRVSTSILDDGWTYAAPPIVALASVDSGVGPVPDCVSVTGVTTGTGTLAVRLLDAERDVMVTVR